MVTFPIIEKLGGQEEVFRLLNAKGLIRTERAIGMWGTRGNIPGDAQRELMALADRRGVSYTAKDFRPVARAAA